MRAVFALVLVVGMALAGVAVYMAQNYIGQSQAALAKANEFRERTGKLVQVYAVNRVMKFGEPLTPADVSPVYVQESFLPAGAFKVLKEGEVFAAPKPVEAKDGEVVIAVAMAPLFPENETKPRFVMRSMEPNEILLASRVTEPGQMAGLTGKLERACAPTRSRLTSPRAWRAS